MGRQPVLVAGDVPDPAGDLQLAVAGPGHPLLVDGEGDHTLAVVADQRQHRVAACPPVLQVDGVDDAAARVGLEGPPEHHRVGGVEDERRLDRLLERLDRGRHLVRLVVPLGDGDADVEGMRPPLDLAQRHPDDPVVVVGEEQLLDPPRPLGVDPFPDQERPGLLVQLGRPDARGQPWLLVRLARHGCGPADAVDQGRDVSRGGPAAATHHVDSQGADELLELVGHRPRLHRVVGAPADVDGQPGVGDAGDGQPGVLAEMADRLAHLVRAGRAVEADHVDPEPLEDGEHGGDVGAEQHPAGDVQRGLGLDRDPAAGALECLARSEDRRLHLQDVLARLDDQQVDPARQEPLGLLPERRQQLTEADPAQARVAAGREEARRPHAAGDETWPGGGGMLVGQPASQPGRLLVELPCALPGTPFREAQGGRLEGAGLDDVGADLEV